MRRESQIVQGGQERRRWMLGLGLQGVFTWAMIISILF